jgi:hypothetical protein
MLTDNHGTFPLSVNLRISFSNNAKLTGLGKLLISNGEIIQNINVKVFLCLIEFHLIKTYGRVAV